MTWEQNILVTLSRIGLLGKPEELDTEGVDWKEVIEEGTMQGVSAVSMHGFQLLLKEELIKHAPIRIDLLKWYGLVTKSM